MEKSNQIVLREFYFLCDYVNWPLGAEITAPTINVQGRSTSRVIELPLWSSSGIMAMFKFFFYTTCAPRGKLYYTTSTRTPQFHSQFFQTPTFCENTQFVFLEVPMDQPQDLTPDQERQPVRLPKQYTDRLSLLIWSLILRLVHWNFQFLPAKIRSGVSVYSFVRLVRSLKCLFL